jgi:hypothetical protein
VVVSHQVPFGEFFLWPVNLVEVGELYRSSIDRDGAFLCRQLELGRLSISLDKEGVRGRVFFFVFRRKTLL